MPTHSPDCRMANIVPRLRRGRPSPAVVDDAAGLGGSSDLAYPRAVAAISAGIMDREMLAWYEDVARRWRPGSEAFSIHDFSGDSREFSADEIAACWTDLLRDDGWPSLRKRISLYVHALLCPTKCAYCHCDARAVSSKSERDALVDAIIREAALFEPLFRGVEFLNASFGGGTPNIFTPSQLSQLFEGTFDRFVVRSSAERSIEFNPANTTPEKLALARSFFNRLSFGVETHTPGVLRAYNRAYQNTSRVRRAVSAAFAAGFEDLNLDHILLGGETRDTWRESVRLSAELGVSTLTLFRYRAGEFGQPGHDNALRPGAGFVGNQPMAFREGYDIFCEVCAGHGYDVAPTWSPSQLAYEATRRGYRSRWPIEERYSEDPLNDASILGLGPQSRSVCRGRVAYVNQSRRIGSNPFASSYQGNSRTRHHDARGFLITYFSMGMVVPRERFQRCFGRDVLEVFPEELDAVRSLGAVRIDDEKLAWACSDPLRRKAVALALAGREDVVALERALNRRKLGSPDGASLGSPVPPWLEPGCEIGTTGWRLRSSAGGDGRWAIAEGPRGAMIRIRLARLREGEHVFRASGGWGVSYQGTDLPTGGSMVLETLLEMCRRGEPAPGGVSDSSQKG